MDKSVTDWIRKEIGEPDKTVRLNGGINSQVFRIMMNGDTFIVKTFAKSCPDKSQRLANEVRFLEYASLKCPQYVGALIRTCTERGTIVLKEIIGDSFREGEIVRECHYHDACRFVEQINKEEAWKLQPGWVAIDGEADILKHIEDTERRIERLDPEHLAPTYRYRTKEYIDCIALKVQRIRDHAMSLIENGELERFIAISDMLLSPGDFGFHNALKTRAGIVFIDFEFSGLDDPCKIACDFFMQPKIPVRMNWDELLKVLKIKNSQKMEARLRVMKKVLYLKWLSIIMKYADREYLDRQVRDGIISSVDAFCRGRIETVKRFTSSQGAII